MFPQQTAKPIRTVNRLISLAKLCLLVCAASLLTQKAAASITVTDLIITSNSISLTFNGTLPEIAPSANLGVISLVNTDYSGGFIFSQNNNLVATTIVDASTSPAPSSMGLGRQSHGDYAYIIFSTGLTAGGVFNGTVSANWTGSVINHELWTAPGQIEVRWGTNEGGPDTGVLLTAIPEPSTVALSAGVAVFVAVAVSRRRQKRS